MSLWQISKQLRKMRRDWDDRARENAKYYVATGREDWTEEDFYRSGEIAVEQHVHNDLRNICQGRAPAEMSVLEIGCGAGRLTRALAKFFGEVYAVDISGEMVKRARKALSDFPTAHILQNNGKDLSVVPKKPLDFAFSYIVFQHISNREIIENYVREVNRLLRTGGLFKFQLQGYSSMEWKVEDTWVGASFTEDDAREMAERSGFEMRHQRGEGTQEYWLWFFKTHDLD
jgi:SAM-dependent methyltransferase